MAFGGEGDGRDYTHTHGTNCSCMIVLLKKKKKKKKKALSQKCDVTECCDRDCILLHLVIAFPALQLSAVIEFERQFELRICLFKLTVDTIIFFSICGCC